MIPNSSIVEDNRLHYSDERRVFLCLMNTFEMPVINAFYFSTWTDERLYPAYVAAASFLALVVHAISSKSFRRLIFKRNDDGDTAREDVAPDWISRRRQENTTIFAFKVARLVTLVGLLALTAVTAYHDGWTWYNVALISTSVRTPSPFVKYSPVLTTLTGLCNHAGCSERFHNSEAVHDSFLPLVSCHAGYVRRVHLPRHMASDDLHSSSS